MEFVASGGLERTGVCSAQPIDEEPEPGQVSRHCGASNLAGQGSPRLTRLERIVGNRHHNTQRRMQIEVPDRRPSCDDESPVDGCGGVVGVSLDVRNDLEDAPRVDLISRNSHDGRGNCRGDG